MPDGRHRASRVTTDVVTPEWRVTTVEGTGHWPLVLGRAPLSCSVLHRAPCSVLRSNGARGARLDGARRSMELPVRTRSGAHRSIPYIFFAKICEFCIQSWETYEDWLGFSLTTSLRRRTCVYKHEEDKKMFFLQKSDESRKISAPPPVSLPYVTWLAD